MGNVLSSRTTAAAATDTQPMLTQRGSVLPPPAPLFLDEIEPTPAAWSQESKCVLVQRFLGFLPDSTAEKLKQDQKAALYFPRVVVHDLSHATLRGHAIVVVQRVYRRYCVLRKWQLVSWKVVAIVRTARRERAAQEEEDEVLDHFREILSSGFSAQKVSINGALKNIQLQLVVRPDEEECYLTWTPSRKRQPRIHLHDVQEVVPVLKEGNKHAPRLANKVSHRRGLVIVCKSHHRGRVVLQMSSKRERKVLLLGFQRLLEDLNRFEPTLDATGAIRKRMPRRQSTIQFFETDPQRRGSTKDMTGDHDGGDDGDDAKAKHDEELRGETRVDESTSDTEREPPVSPTSKPTKHPSTSIAKFYQTRFDESPTSADGASEQTKPGRLARRSSVVV